MKSEDAKKRKQKYDKENFVNVGIKLKKEQKKLILEYVEKDGSTLSKWIKNAIMEQMDEQDKEYFNSL